MNMPNRSAGDFGRYYDDFTEGDTYEHWPGKTITEFDNHLFSLLTMNHHPVHIDHEYAEGQHHGEVLVLGPLVISLVVGMSVRDTSGKAIANLDYEDISHDRPVFIGDTIYAESEVLDKRRSESNPETGIIHLETRAYNQHSEQVLTIRRHFLVPVENHES